MAFRVVLQVSIRTDKADLKLLCRALAVTHLIDTEGGLDFVQLLPDPSNTEGIAIFCLLHYDGVIIKAFLKIIFKLLVYFAVVCLELVVIAIAISGVSQLELDVVRKKLLTCANQNLNRELVPSQVLPIACINLKARHVIWNREKGWHI